MEPMGVSMQNDLVNLWKMQASIGDTGLSKGTEWMDGICLHYPVRAEGQQIAKQSGLLLPYTYISPPRSAKIIKESATKIMV